MRGPGFSERSFRNKPDSGGYAERPWDTHDFRDPDDLAELDDLNVAEMLQDDWLNKTVEFDEDGAENEDEDFVR